MSTVIIQPSATVRDQRKPFTANEPGSCWPEVLTDYNCHWLPFPFIRPIHDGNMGCLCSVIPYSSSCFMAERRNTNSLLKLWKHLDRIFTSQGRDNTVRLIELHHTTDMHLDFSAVPKSPEGQSLSSLRLEEINLTLCKRLNFRGRFCR